MLRALAACGYRSLARMSLASISEMMSTMGTALPVAISEMKWRQKTIKRPVRMPPTDWSDDTTVRAKGSSRVLGRTSPPDGAIAGLCRAGRFAPGDRLRAVGETRIFH